MTKRVLSLLLLLAVAPAGAVLEGCTDEDDDCRYDYSQEFYDVQGVTLAARRLATRQVLAAGEAALATEVYLEAQTKVRYYSFRSRHSSWLPAAYACPPAPIPGYGGTDELLDSLVVRSAYAYDAAHPAGSSLNDLLLYESTGQPLPPVPERGTRPPSGAGYLTLRLKQGPAQAGPQQFVLRYRLTNGEAYTARTPVFELR